MTKMSKDEAEAWANKHRDRLREILAFAHPLRCALQANDAEMVALIMTADEAGAIVVPMTVGGRRAIDMANAMSDAMSAAGDKPSTEIEAWVNIAILIHYKEGLELLGSLREQAVEIQRRCDSYTGYFDHSEDN